jgi:hypothetical protein
MRTGARLLPEWSTSAVQHRRISRCTIKWRSTVLRRKPNCFRGICRRCIIKRLPQTFKAFSFAGDIAISGGFDGAPGINTFAFHFGQAFF